VICQQIETDKSFLVLFFKKERLPYGISTAAPSNLPARKSASARLSRPAGLSCGAPRR
jgi:hypothetical protein